MSLRTALTKTGMPVTIRDEFIKGDGVTTLTGEFLYKDLASKGLVYLVECYAPLHDLILIDMDQHFVWWIRPGKPMVLLLLSWLFPLQYKMA